MGLCVGSFLGLNHFEVSAMYTKYQLCTNRDLRLLILQIFPFIAHLGMIKKPFYSHL